MATTTTKSKQPAATMNRKIRPGFISHTELASKDPTATKAWCEKVLGWEFSDPVPTPTGPYNMWRFDEGSGGGIRATNGPEAPGTVPYVEVADIKASWTKALKAGAKEMMAPAEVPSGGGWIAMCQIPGGPTIGFWSTGK